MNETQEKAIRRIAELQTKQTEGSAPWVVGEQLKEICEREPRSAELLLEDLRGEGMGLAEAEKQIKAWADKHRTGGFAFVSPKKAEEILRQFYGLPGGESDPSSGASRHLPTKGKASDGAIDLRLEDFF